MLLSIKPSSYFKNKKTARKWMVFLMIISILLLILPTISISLLSLRIIFLYPALGLEFSIIILFLDIGIHMGMMALGGLGIAVSTSYLDEGNTAQWLNKVTPGNLKKHFDKYFSENMKNFDEVLTPNSIRVEYNF